MSRPILDISPLWINSLLKCGHTKEFLRNLSDVFFAHRWIAKNVSTYRTQTGEVLYLFSINRLHKSSRFKDSKRERVSKVVQSLIDMNICSDPIKISEGNWRPTIMCPIDGRFLPDHEHNIKDLHAYWMQNWFYVAS